MDYGITKSNCKGKPIFVVPFGPAPEKEFRILGTSGSPCLEMNDRSSDFALLREFVRERHQPAFAALVRHHVDLVYGTALRKVEDCGAAG